MYWIDPKTGSIKSGWGEDLFYMPHGMTIDVHGNYWIDQSDNNAITIN